MSLTPHEEDMFAKLRETFLQDLSRTARSFLNKLENEGRSAPKTLQEIPPLAKELMEVAGIPQPEEEYKLKSGEIRDYKNIKPSHEIVRLGLELAKASHLLHEGMDLPLRRIWYAFIKALLERGLKGYIYSKGKQEGEQREADAADYYEGFSDIIKSSSDLWYSDYGVKNTGKMTYVPYNWKLFEPIMIGVEKTSYFEVLKNMCDMLGLALYAAGGESSVSASEEIMKRVDPLMKEGKRKHLNIYAITDFDPAGYDIARNIYEHSKLFIERFGGDASFERLAPLPKHYTDIELEQGLYTMKGTFNKDHLGYDNVTLLDDIDPSAIGAIQQREAEGAIEFEMDDKDRYTQGLEIESLPEEPLEELLKNPPSRMPSNYSGIARMRFLIFDDLIERHGLDAALLFLLNLKTRGYSTYNGMELANKIINKNDPDEIIDEVYQASDKISDIKYYMDEWITEYLKDEKEAVAKQIDLWIEDVIDKYTNTSHIDYDDDETQKLKNLIRDKVYNALASNSSYISFDFPDKFEIGKVKDEDDEFYPDDFEITIPDDIIDNINPIVKWAKCMAYNAETVKEYLQGLDDPLNEEWEIPLVRPCQINDEGEIEFIDTIETIEKDCTEYKTKIRKLNDVIADLEGDIIKLEGQLEETEKEESEEEPEQRRLAEERLTRIAEMRTEKNALTNKLEDLETEYVKLNTKYRDLSDIVDKQVIKLQEFKNVEDQINRLNKLIEECNIEKEKLNKKIEEGLMPEEAEKILLALEELRKDTAKQIDELRKELKARPVPTKTTPTAAVKKEVKKEVEKIQKSVAEKWEEMKQTSEDKELAKMKNMIAILNEEMTGTDYYGNWGEKPMSWDEMKDKIPMELFTESKLIRDLGEGSLDAGRNIWEELSDKEKNEMINKNLVGFASLKDQIEEEKELSAEIREHLHDVLGGDLPLLTEDDESYEDTLERVPFKYWYESPDVDEPDVFNKRIRIYNNHIKNAPETIKMLIGEKIDVMKKLYKDSQPKIKQATGQDRFNQLSLLSGDLNKLNADIKKLFYYGR